MGINKTQRAKLKLSSPNNCWYCGAGNPSTVDHVVAIANGGSDNLDNLVLACKRCNSTKRDLSVRQFRFVMSWKNSKYSEIIGAPVAKRLMAAGVVFDDFANDHVFWFEGFL